MSNAMAVRSESPQVDDVSPSKLVEAVLVLLEAAGIDTETNDKIVALIETAELLKMLTPKHIEVLRFVHAHGNGISYAGDRPAKRRAAEDLIEAGLLRGSYQNCSLTDAGRRAAERLSVIKPGD